MKLKNFKNCLQVRQKTLVDAIKYREEGKQDFSSWRFTSIEELYGRLSEVKNTLDMQGNISIGEYIGSGSQSYESWKGIAVEVARIEAFDSMDGDDFSYFPQDDAELTEEEKTAFAAWCKQNGEEPEPGLLSEWNPEVAKRWEKVYREEYIAAYADDYAGAEFSRMIRDLEMLEKYAEL